ncbi:MAG TPA: Gfo/Idh/MocA family oxidoreductase, partial [Reyranella sp.]|nr:Gfo/Idh/MocA family oxidoreductase [Reyranella sp.]
MTIRVAIVGYGYWGPNLLRNFAANGNFEVVALADRRPEARAAAQRAVRGLRCYEDGLQVIALPDVDAVVVATPVATHFDLARRA